MHEKYLSASRQIYYINPDNHLRPYNIIHKTETRLYTNLINRLIDFDENFNLYRSLACILNTC